LPVVLQEEVITALYLIEASAKDKNSEEEHQARQEKSEPHLHILRTWLDKVWHKPYPTEELLRP